MFCAIFRSSDEFEQFKQEVLELPDEGPLHKNFLEKVDYLGQFPLALEGTIIR